MASPASNLTEQTFQPTLRQPGDSRGFTQLDWLQSWHTFSFGEYHDPAMKGFGKLRVINEDIVAPNGGFATHPHANMEIVTVVLSGVLQHQDSLGNGSLIEPGQVQVMSAGTGIEHSEFNPSPSTPVHLLQLWIHTHQRDVKPRYDQANYDASLTGQWVCLVSDPKGDGAVWIYQDARINWATIPPQSSLSYELSAHRLAWVHAIEGTGAFIEGQPIKAGDGVGFEAQQDAASLLFNAADTPLKVLVFDLPPL